VNEATLDAIQLIPQQSELSVGMQKDFIAIGYYSNGSSLDISQQVDWMSSHTDVLQMSSSVAHPTTPGSTLITASLNGVSAQANVTVNSATLQRIEISPLPGAIELTLKHKLIAYAFYSNQSMHDISDQVN
ncbi:MAG: Ig-like domain-containing protein, partial [Gammaproteobacteria bacterium]|nr:Ig-like domain-containing protein [Gammaproteobacteria bacterium]